jgi:hypothetical protein
MPQIIHRNATTPILRQIEVLENTLIYIILSTALRFKEQCLYKSHEIVSCRKKSKE